MIQLQGGNADISCITGLHIAAGSAFAVVKFTLQPVIIIASGVDPFDKRFRVLAPSHVGIFYAFNILRYGSGNIDIKKHFWLEIRGRHLQADIRRQPGSIFIVGLAYSTANTCGRYGNSAAAAAITLGSSGHSAGINYICTQIWPVIDTGDYHVRQKTQKLLQGQFGAISRGTVYGPGIIGYTGQRLPVSPQRLRSGKTMAGAALFCGRSRYINISYAGQFPAQSMQSRGIYSIVIANKDSNRIYLQFSKGANSGKLPSP